jgi:hypothetical protein
MIGAHVSTIEAEFSVCGRAGGYVTSSKWNQFSSVWVQLATVEFTPAPQLRTRRQVTGLCLISCEANNCSLAKERPNKHSYNLVSLLITDALLGNTSLYCVVTCLCTHCAWCVVLPLVILCLFCSFLRSTLHCDKPRCFLYVFFYNF